MTKLEKFLIFIGITGILIVIIPIFLYIIFFGLNISHDHRLWAESGDFFGGILNPILAFLSFIALLLTINIQIKEHRASIHELEETKRIHSEQSVIFSNQNIEIIKDKFEKRFFQLMEIHSRSEEKLFYKGYAGTLAFPIIEQDITRIIEENWIKQNKEFIQKIQDYFDGNSEIFDPFFRSLMFTVDFVLNLKNKNIFNQDELDFYFSTIRSQLTKSKMNVIFFAATVFPHPEFSREKLKKSKLVLNISHVNYIQELTTRFPELVSQFYL
ncbi:hypothetical protein AB3N62_11260 [Leptospira sp. WS4.C2]